MAQYPAEKAVSIRESIGHGQRSAIVLARPQLTAAAPLRFLRTVTMLAERRGTGIAPSGA
jgi:hypothetical protein